ncbi:MAG: hypothetical protein ACLGH3_08895 [Actinomycetota bacterium]
MDPFAALGVAAAFLIGVTGHEFLTHLAAASQGDQAPRFQRRVTLDLRQHADPFGTWVLGIGFSVLVLLGTPMPFWFAYGKPHALAPSYQSRRGPRRWIPLVGPAFTLALAALVGHLANSLSPGAIRTVLQFATITFLYLSAIELLPLPGRDGGRLLATALSPQAAMKMEELRVYEGLFVVGIFLIFPGAVRTVTDLLASVLQL